MRRKPGALVPLETAILVAVAELDSAGDAPCHGYQIGKHLAASDGRTQLTAYGTLYRALARLEGMALVASAWEDPQTAAAERRPVRRLYSVTAAGRQVARDAQREARRARGVRAPRKGVAPA